MRLDKSINRLKEFVASLESKQKTKEPSLESFPEVLFTRSNLGGLMLWGEEAREYRSCVLDIYAAVQRQERLSLRAAESLVQTAILEALDVDHHRPDVDFQTRLAEALEKLRELLWLEPQEWEIHLQVLGVETAGLPCKVGDIKIYPAEEDFREQLKLKTNSIIDSCQASEALKESLRDISYRNIDELMANNAYAEVHVEAIDANAARALAVKKLRMTIDIINFYVDLLRLAGGCVYLPGEKKTTPSFSPQFRQGKQPRIIQHIAVWGPVGSVRVSELTGDRASHLGFAKVSQLLSKANRTALEERILSAIQWTGRARANERREERFLMFAIALEALLLGNKERGDSGYKLSLRGAHVLGRQSATRRAIQKEIRDLYARRSAIVHSGSFEVSDAELQRIGYLAKQAIVTLLVVEPFSRMCDEKDLQAWFDNQVLAGED